MGHDNYFVRRCYDRPDEYDTQAGWVVIPMYDYGFPQIMPGSPNYPPPDLEPVIQGDDLFELMLCSKYNGPTIAAIMSHLLCETPIGALAKQHRLKPRSLSVACSRTRCELGFPRK
jgi:hypothetical protein